MIKDVKVVFGKAHGSEPVPNDADGHAPMWKKKSIFWELPYWQVLEVRSAIDVMHLTMPVTAKASLPSVFCMGILRTHLKHDRTYDV